MKCTKSMLITGAAILAVLALAYAALPQFRTLVVSVGPYLLLLLCPLSMMFMMKGMDSNKDHQEPPRDNQQYRLPPEGEQLKK
ncbi:DUF2933 domain-containing protein [Ralstonia pickettii]|uniref:DUF2933 domain-containing protein n=1 Tax=Ralstonia pickettii TaxID=329 RepID=UPI000468D404|nr:DUF2933 domain-containing protein [Ralstonia pickettii]